MLWKLFVAFALMATCVVIHASSVTSALRWLRMHGTMSAQLPYLSRIWLFVRIAAWIILFHLLEIAVWATFYWWQGAMPDLAGGALLQRGHLHHHRVWRPGAAADWRLVGGVEALTGILMCGWSTGFFFAVVSRLEWAPPANTPRV